MRVRAKERVRFVVEGPDTVISYAAQEGSKWNAFHEPEVNANLPWRVQHKFANVRMTEERFLELFEKDVHNPSNTDSLIG